MACEINSRGVKYAGIYTYTYIVYTRITLETYGRRCSQPVWQRYRKRELASRASTAGRVSSIRSAAENPLLEILDLTDEQIHRIGKYVNEQANARADGSRRASFHRL